MSNITPPIQGAYHKKTGQCTKSGRDMDHNDCWLWEKKTTLLAQICLVIKPPKKQTSEKKEGKKKVLGKVTLKWYSYINYMYKTGFRVEISLDLVNTDQAVTLCPRAAAVCGCNMSNLPTPCKFIRTDTKNYGGHEKDYQNTRLNISIVSIHMQKGCLNIEI